MGVPSNTIEFLIILYFESIFILNLAKIIDWLMTSIEYIIIITVGRSVLPEAWDNILLYAMVDTTKVGMITQFKIIKIK